MTAAPTIVRRAAEARDERFLRELFAESRPDLALLPPPMRESIIDLQCRAQHQHYQAAYPHARPEVVECGGIDVGQLIVHHGSGTVRIVDITVASAHRGRGIATAVLGQLLAEADRSAYPVELSVWSANDGARRLYARLGFAATAEADDGYVRMRRSAVEKGAGRG